MEYLLAFFSLFAADPEIKSDEQVVFFPTTAWYDKTSDSWQTPIHGWIFEPEPGSWRRELVLDMLGVSFEFADDSPEAAIFHRRGAWLLVDNERDKQVQIRLGDQTYELPESAANGHFQTTLAIPSAVARAWGVTTERDTTVAYSAITKTADRRKFTGQIHFLAPRGTSIVSDIDDTIKISEVLDRQKLLENTFLKPFRATPGMVEAYRRYAERGLAFHYVSASPWQLFPELHSFAGTVGYPAGSWHLKPFRTLDRSALNLLADPVEYKLATIEPLLKSWPERRFILIGDTGEKDPEVYGELARRHPAQIERIWLRNVTDEQPDAPRYHRAMRDLPSSQWRLFVDGAELSR
ncbi:MAG: App1 family protein [Planctomycetaceae bacterium]|nr:App1 family protein [Planctomycetaceae bacterium]